MKMIHGKAVFDRLEELLHPKHCALLVADMQNDFCAPGGHYARHGKDVNIVYGRVPVLRTLVDAARHHSVFVALIQTATLPNGTSDSPAWLSLKTRDGKSPAYCLPGTWGQGQVEGLERENHEPLVIKHRSSSFVGTNLELLLRAQGIQTVVISGTATEGCVDTTARDASVRDFYVVIAKDCVASTNPELHRSSLAILASRYESLSSSDIIQIWQAIASQAKGATRA